MAAYICQVINTIADRFDERQIDELNTKQPWRKLINEDHSKKANSNNLNKNSSTTKQPTVPKRPRPILHRNLRLQPNHLPNRTHKPIPNKPVHSRKMGKANRKKPHHKRTAPALCVNKPEHQHRHSRTKLETNQTHNQTHQRIPHKNSQKPHTRNPKKPASPSPTTAT